MALSYSVDVKIDALYGKEAIRKILMVGKKLGFIYRKFELGNSDLSLPSLAVEEAVESVFDSVRVNKMACLFLQIQDTYLALHFLDFEKLGIMFSSLSDNWSKVFTNGTEDIDVARYTKELLNLIEDFRILEMHIEKD